MGFTTVSDTYVDIHGTAIAGQAILAVPTYTPLFENFGGTWKEIAALGQFSSTTDGSGVWSIAIPWPSVLDPSSVKWNIILPDRPAATIWQGQAIEGDAGTYTLKQMKDSHGWALLQGSVSGATNAVQGPPGIVDTPSLVALRAHAWLRL